MRVFSINWIILGNTFYLLSYNQVGALSKVLDLGKDLAFQLVLQTTFAVDTFFFISGLLVTHRTLRKLGENQDQLNLLKFYIHRYWRLTPAFVLISALIIIAPNFGSGPIWHDKLDTLAKVCRKNWWTNLLYISNFLKPENICVPHGFYLACEMQFFLLSPVFIMTLYRKSIVGKLLLALGIFGSMVTVGILTPLFNQMPTLLFSITEPNTLPMTWNYGKIVAFLGWTVAFTCNLAVVFGVYAWNRGYLPRLVTGAVYACVSRFVWTLGLSWVVVACTNGYGGTINSLLSWKFYIPLSRVSYMVFLLHPAFIIFFSGHYRSTLYYSSCLVFYLFIAYTSVSYLGGFLCSLFYQTPFWSLERFFVSLMSKNTLSTDDDLNRDGSQNGAEDDHWLTRNKKELDLKEVGITMKNYNARWGECGTQNKVYTAKV
ncbi:O-acyltransferase like protein-like [Limulus polyphemus]|uniref:O-acyltransferase like protein-like n=1 Tax=Limulus polyphemus TaxID=6850 RepID=A0ABM1SLV6_LIMPO|nr:O-acyltransferase like protein-like [Limulus polyphemus]